MARQPSGNDSAKALDDSAETDSEALDESAGAQDEQGVVDEVDDAEEADDVEEVDEADAAEERSPLAPALWSDVRVDPVEIALPKGVGFTLRAYRLSTEVTRTAVEAEDDDDFAILNRRAGRTIDDERADLDAFEEDELDPEALDAEALDAADADDDTDEPRDARTADRRNRRHAGTREKDRDEDDEDADANEPDAIEDDEDADHEADEDEAEPEEVPAFLTQQGKLLLFATAEELVAFVKSDAEHDLTQLDTWESLKTRITPAAVAPTDQDRYELDLVVENLRGGHDAWDTDLLISAGEVARDLAYALQLEPVRTALSAGSPLDDLDEALRGNAEGGVGGFFARRRMKKIGAQQAALGWRTIIGKISAAVDWRD